MESVAEKRALLGAKDRRYFYNIMIYLIKMKKLPERYSCFEGVDIGMGKGYSSFKRKVFMSSVRFNYACCFYYFYYYGSGMRRDVQGLM